MSSVPVVDIAPIAADPASPRAAAAVPVEWQSISEAISPLTTSPTTCSLKPLKVLLLLLRPWRA